MTETSTLPTSVTGVRAEHLRAIVAKFQPDPDCLDERFEPWSVTTAFVVLEETVYRQRRWLTPCDTLDDARDALLMQGAINEVASEYYPLMVLSLDTGRNYEVRWTGVELDAVDYAIATHGTWVPPTNP